MNKNLLTILIVTFVVFGLNAQSLSLKQTKSGKSFFNSNIKELTIENGLKSGKVNYISESFDTEIPATWTVINNSGGDNDAWLWNAGGWATIDSDGQGTVYENDRVAGELITPTVDVSGETIVLIKFDHFFKSDEYNSNNGKVEVWDGTQWIVIADYNETHGYNTSNMEHVQFDVSEYINSDFKVRFNFDDAGVWAYYWHIDNIVVMSPEPHDLGVNKISPSYVISGQTVTPQITIYNNGSTNETTYTVTITDGDTYISTVNVSEVIAIGEEIIIDMDAYIPISGISNFTATVTVVGDANTENNELAIQCLVMEERDTYTWNTQGLNVNKGPAIVTLPTGELTSVIENSYGYATCGDWVENTWYVIFREPGINGSYFLAKIDINSGVTTVIGEIANADDITGMAYDATTSIMYIASYNGTGSDFYKIDLITSNIQFVGEIDETAMIIGIASDINGDFWGVDIEYDHFYQINKETGAGTDIGALGIDLDGVQDIAFDRDNDILFGTLFGMNGGLYTINTNTGVANLVSTIDAELAAFAIPYTNISTDFITFSFPEQTSDAEINTENHTIKIEVAYGTEIDNLAAQFTTSYAAVVDIVDENQISGTTVNDFTSPVIYTVTAEDGVTEQDWTVTVTITTNVLSDVATLSDLTYDGTIITDFSATIFEYNVELESGTTAVPVVVGTPTDDNASTEITDANELPGITTLLVTAEDGITTELYTINFTVAASSINNILDGEISIYPNPSNGEFSINVNDNYNLDIIDIAGRVINSIVINSNSKINISESGIYFLRFSNNTGTYTEKVFVK